jgi:hypothetical protein
MAHNENFGDRVTPERIIQIYSEGGMTINVDQAKQILEFMYMLADVALDIAEEDLRKEKLSGSNPNGFKTDSE